MKTVQSLIFFFFMYIHFFSSKLFFKKPIICDVQEHLDNFNTSYNFFGVFSDSEHFFYFLCSSYQRKVRAVRSFPPQKWSKLDN